MPRTNIIIDDSNYKQHIIGRVNGQVMGRGLVARDLQAFPVGYSAAAPAWSTDIPLIPRSEWSARIKEMEETKSRLSDMRRRANNGKPFPSLNQGSEGFCWAYGTAQGAMLLRAKSGLSYARLSAHAIGCKVKGFKNQGGWGAQSLDFMRDYGCPTTATWKEQSMSRSNDTEATWVDAAKYKVTEGFVELNAAVYDRDLTFDQMMTCLLNRIPVVIDLMWWSHCVVAMDPVEVEAGSFGHRDLNSWGDSYGDLGEFILRGQKAVPDNAVAPRATLAA